MVQQNMQRKTATTEIHLHQNQRTQTARHGANNVTSVTAYVILYSYIQVHTLVQIKSI